MADKKPQATRIITPAFIATLAYIGTPSQYGRYTVRGTFDPKIPEHRKFLGTLKKLHQAAVAEARATFKPTKKIKELTINDAYTENEDSPTFYVTMSEKAVITWKDKKTGEDKSANLKPTIADAKGQACDVDPWGGSKLKAAIDVSPYLTAKGECGISLRLKGVQVLELVTRRDAAPIFGEAEEGGFDSSNFMASAGSSSSTSDDDDFDDEFGDFGSEDDDEEGGETAAAPAAGEATGTDDDFDF